MRFDRTLCAMRNQRAFAAMIFAALIAGGLAGCGIGKPDLTVTSVANNQRYQQPFTHAFASQRNGDLEVVLADDAALAALSGQPAGAPVRQILHIHVFWRPDHGMGGPVTNATLHWYVIGDPYSRPGEMLEYTGTAFVTAGGKPDAPSVNIQAASLKCAYQHGLADPVGASRLEGYLTAVTDDNLVAQLLKEVESAAESPSAVTTTPAAPNAAAGQ